MKKKTLLIMCAALVMFLVCATLLYNVLYEKVDTVDLAPVQTTAPATEPQEETVAPTQASTEATEPDYSAPDFTVLDGEGNERKLSDFVGKPVILNFWASWCGPCKSEMPDFEEAYKKYGDEIHFLMVNCTASDTVKEAEALIEECGYTFPVYFDTTGEASYVYGASSIPMTFFIDAEGNLVTYARGALTAEWLQKGIDYIYTEE